MASQHAPAGSGRRPQDTIQEPAITCPNPDHQCAWGFRVALSLWELKFINDACGLHRLLPLVAPEPVQQPVRRPSGGPGIARFDRRRAAA